MRSSYRCFAIFLGLMLAIPLAGWAQTSSENMAAKIDELEQTVSQLKAELAAMKAAGASSAPSSAQAAESKPVAAPAQNLNAPEEKASAQSKTSLGSLLGPTSFSGFVDGYYSLNFNHPAPGNNPLFPTTGSNVLRSFDLNSNQFALNLVELVVDKTPNTAASRTGYHVALGFGQAMNVVNLAEPGNAGLGGLSFDQYLKEAYFSYLAPVGKGLQIDFGKFVTPMGAEVIETKDNWNYSRGLLFSYAIPFYHFGLRAKYTVNEKGWVAGYVTNGWNNIVDNNSGKTYGASVGWNPSAKFGLVQNYMAGPESLGTNTGWRQVSDTVVTISPTSKFSFMANYDYGHDHVAGVPVYWTGIAGYLRYTLNDRYAVATRYEYYNDHDGFTTGVAQHLNGITATLQRTIAGNLITRLEYRRDVSNQPVFVKGTRDVLGQSTLTAGMVLTFDTRESK